MLVDGDILEDAVGNLYRYLKGYWLVNGKVASTIPVMPLTRLRADD